MPLPPRLKNRVIESMTRLEVGGYVVRVWKEEGGLVLGPSKEVERALVNCTTTLEIVRALDRLNVAAYEILKDGQGVVVYPDW